MDVMVWITSIDVIITISLQAPAAALPLITLIAVIAVMADVANGYYINFLALDKPTYQIFASY